MRERERELVSLALGREHSHESTLRSSLKSSIFIPRRNKSALDCGTVNPNLVPHLLRWRDMIGSILCDLIGYSEVEYENESYSGGVRKTGTAKESRYTAPNNG
eukprot:GFYU01029878.1.p1 GENE.GFYU01029878.1~~GFYU01029878.1.p1  ORF type:complete len:103 (-),score=5.34 GFYU01029878.1:81-389(-)